MHAFRRRVMFFEAEKHTTSDGFSVAFDHPAPESVLLIFHSWKHFVSGGYNEFLLSRPFGNAVFSNQCALLKLEVTYTLICCISLPQPKNQGRNIIRAGKSRCVLEKRFVVICSFILYSIALIPYAVDSFLLRVTCKFVLFCCTRLDDSVTLKASR